MYKIEIKFKELDNEKSSLEAIEITNKETTKFEKASGKLIKECVRIALNEFSNQVKYDENSKDLTELNDLLEDLVGNLEELKETMKDKKKED